MTVLRARELYRFYRAGDEETLSLRGVSIEVPAGKLLTVATILLGIAAYGTWWIRG